MKKTRRITERGIYPNAINGARESVPCFYSDCRAWIEPGSEFFLVVERPPPHFRAFRFCSDDCFLCTQAEFGLELDGSAENLLPVVVQAMMDDFKSGIFDEVWMGGSERKPDRASKPADATVFPWEGASAESTDADPSRPSRADAEGEGDGKARSRRLF